MPVCKECGVTLKSENKFCSNCGTEVIKDTMPSCCGKVLDASDKFCPECGDKVVKRSAPVKLYTCTVPQEDGSACNTKFSSSDQKFCGRCGSPREDASMGIKKSRYEDLCSTASCLREENGKSNTGNQSETLATVNSQVDTSNLTNPTPELQLNEVEKRNNELSYSAVSATSADNDSVSSVPYQASSSELDENKSVCKNNSDAMGDDVHVTLLSHSLGDLQETNAGHTSYSVKSGTSEGLAQASKQNGSDIVISPDQSGRSGEKPAVLEVDQNQLGLQIDNDDHDKDDFPKPDDVGNQDSKCTVNKGEARKYENAKSSNAKDEIGTTETENEEKADYSEKRNQDDQNHAQATDAELEQKDSRVINVDGSHVSVPDSDSHGDSADTGRHVSVSDSDSREDSADTGPVSVFKPQITYAQAVSTEGQHGQGDCVFGGAKAVNIESASTQSEPSMGTGEKKTYDEAASLEAGQGDCVGGGEKAANKSASTQLGNMDQSSLADSGPYRKTDKEEEVYVAGNTKKKKVPTATLR